ncbi:hypothetical protein N5K37_15025 [Delftia tsuruhatensis]|uniref:Uncharacterized protein n=1 Tax=Delftia tsuruhatensis TaxID=180282 RepID=A0ABM6E2Q7_9BURK|nr:hypothetical protein [Delftia tsuruhatensis]AOV01516.1 hypothetical protein BI380_09185 [Delftia tsuruhatensis]MDH2231220.1 hypothetical protein [Delftia tsuruhatensis]
MTAKKDKDEAVHTSAPAPQSTKLAKPAHHQATTLPPRDEFHGKAGRYVRDPATGLRVPQD